MIEMRTFYLWGSILMAISALGGVWSLKLNWLVLNSGGIVSAICGIIFNFLIALVFLGLYRTTPKPMNLVDREEVDKILNQINTSEVKK